MAKLESLTILNYKNIREAELSFSPGVNCLVGNNGMGKTNLLDAIYYMSFCKSQNGMTDSQVITHDEEYFMLKGRYQLPASDVADEIQCGYKLKGRKSFKRSGKEYQRLSDHIGLIPLVMLTPADNELIQGGSELRRKFMDMVISQYDKTYLQALIRYNQGLQQRNYLLKAASHSGMSSGGFSATDPLLFAACEEQMDYYGRMIYNARRKFVDDFTPVFQEFYQMLSMNREQVNLNYTSHFAQSDSLLPLLNAVRSRDLSLGYTTRGSHKDDLEMMLGDYAMRQQGSQGQNKTFLVGLKLAQYEFLKRTCNTEPILLLDDIFDRLDSDRVEQIIRLVSSDKFGQIFITDTNREYLDQIIDRVTDQYKLFTVKDGEFK